MKICAPLFVLFILLGVSCSCNKDLDFLSQNKVNLGKIKAQAEDCAAVQKRFHPAFSRDFVLLYNDLKREHNALIMFLVSTLDPGNTQSRETIEQKYAQHISSVNKKVALLDNSIKEYNRKKKRTISTKSFKKAIEVIATALDRAVDIYSKIKALNDKEREAFVKEFKALQIVSYESVGESSMAKKGR